MNEPVLIHAWNDLWNIRIVEFFFEQFEIKGYKDFPVLNWNFKYFKMGKMQEDK